MEQQSNLSHANLSDADLIGVNLSGTNLSHAKLIRANLSHANLSGANLSHANLSGANLSHANLSGAKLTKAVFGTEERIPFDKSNLLSISEQTQIANWHGEENVSWKLIYRSSEHGAANFHNYCDDKVDTFVIVKSGQNLFGGYASDSWDTKQLNKYVAAPGTFIFTLRNPNNIPMTKYPCLADSNNVMGCYSSYGPCFQAFYLNKDNTGTVRFPSTCVDTTGKGSSTFTGSGTFTANEVEVFARA